MPQQAVGSGGNSGCPSCRRSAPAALPDRLCWAACVQQMAYSLPHTARRQPLEGGAADSRASKAQSAAPPLLQHSWALPDSPTPTPVAQACRRRPNSQREPTRESSPCTLSCQQVRRASMAWWGRAWRRGGSPGAMLAQRGVGCRMPRRRRRPAASNAHTRRTGSQPDACPLRRAEPRHPALCRKRRPC